MEKVTTRCLHFTTSLVLYKQKLSMIEYTHLTTSDKLNIMSRCLLPKNAKVCQICAHWS